LTWARRERIEDPEVLLQTLDHGNSRDNPARLTLLDEVIAKGRAHYSVLLARASELARQSRWREAIDAYRAALAVRRDDPSVWYSLSTALVAAGTPQEQNDFCSEMFDTFFKNEIHGNSWNLVAGSCAYFRGKIDVRPALIDLVADAAPSAKGRYDANADFYSLMLFRERGVDAVASRLSINENSFATIALKAIHLAKHDDAAAAQEQIDVILDNLARRKESSDLYDRLRASDRLRIDSLLQDAAVVGLRITRAEQGDRSEQHGNRTETQDPQP
jgi:tetratricopeptide (TPR) repeat protein